MTDKELIKLFRNIHWDVWLRRGQPIFVVYLMIVYATKQAFEGQGIDGEFPIILYENNIWYGNNEMFFTAEKEAGKYLKKTDAFFITNLCFKAYKKALKIVDKLLLDKKTSPREQLSQIIRVIAPINVSIWTAHAAEEYYHALLKKKLAGIIKEDEIEKFIGDIGFPKKKNAHILMEEDIRRGENIKELHKKYGWMKSRTDGGFGSGYTVNEIKKIKKDILKNPKAKMMRPKVPANLKKITAEFQEIVYLRTLRTDALYEIYFRAQPIFQRIERALGIDSIKNYVPEDLLRGKIKKYGKNFSVLKYYDDIVVTTERIINNTESIDTQIKGTVAWTGKARGKVKIIAHPREIDKVKNGDILVTNMTIPAYIQGMKRAAAFVTDEGGITCHAAILAREMKKPCIIGTKVATTVLKDGDLVEVDADKGIVIIIK